MNYSAIGGSIVAPSLSRRVTMTVRLTLDSSAAVRILLSRSLVMMPLRSFAESCPVIGLTRKRAGCHRPRRLLPRDSH